MPGFHHRNPLKIVSILVIILLLSGAGYYYLKPGNHTYSRQEIFLSYALNHSADLEKVMQQTSRLAITFQEASPEYRDQYREQTADQFWDVANLAASWNQTSVKTKSPDNNKTLRLIVAYQGMAAHELMNAAINWSYWARTGNDDYFNTAFFNVADFLSDMKYAESYSRQAWRMMNET